MKKKPVKKAAKKAYVPKRAAGKKIFNFGFWIKDVEQWREHAIRLNYSLTKLIEVTMNANFKKK